jgi:hypothetical protein
MPGVLTTASPVLCGHGPGQVETASTAKLRVAGSPVLVLDSVLGKPVPPGCTADTPCSSVLTVVTGTAVKLTTAGAPVVLDTLTGTTNGAVSGTTPQPLLSATAEQTKLTAV